MGQVTDIYQKTHDFMECVRQTGLPAFRVHIILAHAGMLSIHDKVNYGTGRQRMGGKAEEYFQKLMPEAVDQNRYYRFNNPDFDFVYRGITIDIKYGGISKAAKPGKPTWHIRLSGKQEITIAFLERAPGTKLDNPYCLFIPHAFVRVKSNAAITKTHPLWTGCRIECGDLKKVMDEYADICESEKNRTGKGKRDKRK